jgi:hypothetical protein
VSYDRQTVGAAIVTILETIDPAVSVFDTPPATFNAPALIVGYERRVQHDASAFGTDDVEQPISAAAGLGEHYRIASLLAAAKVALEADPTCAGTVQNLRPTTRENYRSLNVGGADFLFADLVLEIRA